jgi:[ribosomal protein S5]-alanine N-acetyltransferase
MMIDKKGLIIKIDHKVLLKIINLKDISNKYINWMNDYEVVKFTQQRHFVHNENTVSKFVKEKFNSKNDLLFGIFYENGHVGNIKLGPINWKKKNCEISFILGDKKLWRKGIGYNVVSKLIEFAIKELNIIEFNANYYLDNIGSGKIFKKCGFSIIETNKNIVSVRYKGN